MAGEAQDDFAAIYVVPVSVSASLSLVLRRLSVGYLQCKHNRISAHTRGRGAGGVAGGGVGSAKNNKQLKRIMSVKHTHA